MEAKKNARNTTHLALIGVELEQDVYKILEGGALARVAVFGVGVCE